MMYFIVFLINGAIKYDECDVIIPVYNAPEWVKLCVYAVIKNTSLNILNKL